MVQSSGGLFYFGGDLKPDEMLPWAAALLKQSEENYRNNTDGINCLPPGPKAGIGVGGYPMKILQTPGLVAVLYEYQTIFRQFFTDGRELPEDPNPTWMGYSIGRWDGDTLVVTTAGYNDRTTIDLAGHPHTESLRLIERHRRRDIGHLEVQVTFEDSKAYTRRWTLPMEFALVPDGQLIEYVCENEKDKSHLVGTQGKEFTVPAAILSQYAGTYQSPAYGTSIVSLEEGRLMISSRGAGKIPLVADSETTFTMQGTVVQFVRDAKGSVTKKVQLWPEGDRSYVRKN